MPCVLLVLVAGCGGKSMTSNPGLDAGTTQDAAPDAPASWSPECPASEPAMGSACTHDNLSCEYPSAAQPGCDDVVVCAGGTWGSAVLPGGNPTCEPHGSSPGCPAQASAITPGATCATAGQTCVYATAICQCDAPADPTPNAMSAWFCGPQAGCPVPRPRIGSACATAGQRCDYLQCGDGVTCTGGVWQVSVAGCGG